MGRFVARIYQCRVCGSIISTSEGVKRHGRGCSLKLKSNIPNPSNLEQMAIVDFPCPKIFLHKLHLPSPLSKSDDVESPRGRAKSNRARPRPRYKEWSGKEDDNDDENEDTSASDDQTQPQSEFESFSESDLVDVKPKNKKIKAGNQIRFRNKPDHPYACPIKGCPSRLKTTEKLKVHFIMHLQNNPYACPIPGCNVQLHDAWNFKRHLERHAGKNLLSCLRCGHTYNRKDNLRNHKCLNQRRLKRKTNDPSAWRRTITMSEEDVIMHLKAHFARLRANGFLLKEILDAEIALDSYPRVDTNLAIQTDPVFLGVCEENPDFRDLILGSDYKEREIPLKSPRTAFKCKCCNFTTFSVNHLKRHYRYEHASRPWRCAKCGMTFQRERNLKLHMKYHESTENKVYVKMMAKGKYECTKCGFQSKYEVSVKKHWLLRHKFEIPNHWKVLSKVGNQRKQKNMSESEESDSDSGIQDEDDPEEISQANLISSPVELVEDKKGEFLKVGEIQEEENFPKSVEVAPVKIEHDIKQESTKSMSIPLHEEHENLQLE